MPPYSDFGWEGSLISMNKCMEIKDPFLFSFLISSLINIGDFLGVTIYYYLWIDPLKNFRIGISWWILLLYYVPF